MELKEIVSISGKPGLYKVLATTAWGVVVESLDDKKTRLPVNASQQVASLGEITIYTPDDENIKLQKVLENIAEKQAAGVEIPSHKDNPVTIKEFFEEVAPGYDKDRVYISDIKKVLKWYDLLRANNIA
jgi:translation elongation factor EF-1beta